MIFPQKALGPDGKPRAILVDSSGRLVTTMSPRPAVTTPITKRSLVVDENGKVKLT